jgi:hypothetical protein
MSVGKFFKYGITGALAGAAGGAAVGAVAGFGFLDAITIPLGIIWGVVTIGGISAIVGAFKSDDKPSEEIQQAGPSSTGLSRQQERANAIARMQGEGQDGPDSRFVQTEEARRAFARSQGRNS